MNIKVHHNYFRLPDEARKEIEQAGLYRLEVDVPAVDNDLHWHGFSTRFFILSGELKIREAASDRQLLAGPGSRVDVPARVLHSEFSQQGYRIIAGMSVDPASLTGPVDLHPDLLVKQADSCH